LFPLGEMTKARVRQTARRLGLVPHGIRESQDLCFIPDGDCAAFLSGLCGGALPGAGDLIDPTGRVLGRHRGAWRFTVGQRRGLGLGGGPWYVLAVDPARNRVMVGPREMLLGRVVQVREMNWLVSPPSPASELRAEVQLRYRMPARAATVQVRDNGRAEIRLDEAVGAITPGQFAALYSADTVLGGGWICGPAPPMPEPHRDAPA
ncbi:MAG: tRNA 2-thiouridine(34) synthase MnmA, partial [Lentisphaeria bacterium]|nr:tRNA 2-thiouridine(34) synthase MnmA [Lentisphaeria bacterium]